MELNIPACSVSPRSRKRNMTRPQQTAANAENVLDSGGIGLTTAPEPLAGEGKARGRNDATTREQTYRTICDVLYLREEEK